MMKMTMHGSTQTYYKQRGTLSGEVYTNYPPFTPDFSCTIFKFFGKQISFLWDTNSTYLMKHSVSYEQGIKN